MNQITLLSILISDINSQHPFRNKNKLYSILKELESLDFSKSPQFLPELKRQILLATVNNFTTKTEDDRLFTTMDSYSLSEFFFVCTNPLRAHNSERIIESIANMLKEALPEVKKYFEGETKCKEFTGYYSHP